MLLLAVVQKSSSNLNPGRQRHVTSMRPFGNGPGRMFGPAEHNRARFLLVGINGNSTRN